MLVSYNKGSFTLAIQQCDCFSAPSEQISAEDGLLGQHGVPHGGRHQRGDLPTPGRHQAGPTSNALEQGILKGEVSLYH
jgi:hypothetical protein